MSLLQAAVRYGYAPFMIIGLNAAALFVVSGGHSYAWLALILAVAIATTFMAERISPWHDKWNHSDGDAPANFWHAIVSQSGNIIGVSMIPLLGWLFELKAGGVWPRDWPYLAQLLLGVILADFSFMFMHYLSHRLPILWRLHAVHHGVARIYGLNGLVRHPVHQMLDMALVAPLVLLGMPFQVALLVALAVSIQLLVQHSNIAYELGPFRNQLSIGRIHQLHHVNWGKEGDCNFGLFLTLWDRLFGTFEPEAPRPIRASDIGIDDVPHFPKSYLKQLLFPFLYKPGSGLPPSLAEQSVEPGPR